MDQELAKPVLDEGRDKPEIADEELDEVSGGRGPNPHGKGVMPDGATTVKP